MDFRTQIVKWLAQETDRPEEEIDQWLEVPPRPEMGDFALPCFRLARHLRSAPDQIARQMAPKARQSLAYLQDVQAVKGYINFFVDRSCYIKSVVERALEAGDDLGRQTIGDEKPVLIEYSSPNIAKPFHVGHAFATVLGHALYRLYDRLGYQTVRINHLGDYGTQFGKLIVAYRRWGDDQALELDPINALLQIYVRFHKQAEHDPTLEDEAREAFRRLEQGCGDEVALWKKFRDLSLKAFSEIYRRIGVEFDSYLGESFYSDRIDGVVRFLKSRDILTESEGAQIVSLDEYKLPPCLILKSDGTSIYASRDLAAVLYRWEKYQFHKNIYVVGSSQALHFQQVFAVLDKAGFKPAQSCVHVGFGLVKFPDRKLSTRSGDVIFLNDLLQESVEKTRMIIRDNMSLRQENLSEQEIDDIAEKIGTGAIIYTFLKNGRERDIVFSWDEMLDFNGDSAPYVQYTYARTRSILRKAREKGLWIDQEAPDLGKLGTDDEFALAKLIDGFGPVIEKAAQSYEPYLLVRQVTALARAFNTYYNRESILRTDDPALRQARLTLLEAVCLTLRTGLDLVGIHVVERM